MTGTFNSISASSFAGPVYNLTTVMHPPVRLLDCSQAGISPTDGRHVNAPLVSAHAGGFHAALADGSVRFIGENIDLSTLKKLATRDDGQTLGGF